MDSETDGGVGVVLASVARALAQEVGKLSRVYGTKITVEPEWSSVQRENGVMHRHRTGRVKVLITIEGEE